MTTLAQACVTLATDRDYHLLSNDSKKLILQARTALIEASAKGRNTFFKLPKNTHSFYRDDLIKFLIRDGVTPILVSDDETNFTIFLSIHSEVTLGIIEPRLAKEFSMLKSLEIEGNQYVNKVVRDDEDNDYNVRFYTEYNGTDLVSMKRTLFAQYDIHLVHREDQY